MLLKKLKDLLGSESTATGEVEHRALELACAALMFEVARADFTVETTEQDAVTSLLTAQFNLGADEVSTITEAAVEQADAATCLFEFTRTLNELASAEQKRDLLAMMWRVAMADNEISRYEDTQTHSTALAVSSNTQQNAPRWAEWPLVLRQVMPAGVEQQWRPFSESRHNAGRALLQ